MDFVMVKSQEEMLSAAQPALAKAERKFKEASLKSLREFRRNRLANRQLPHHPKVA
jgi:hypothetical protein